MRSNNLRVHLLALALIAPCTLLAQQMETTAVTFTVVDPAGTAIAYAQIAAAVRSQIAILRTDEHGHLSLSLPSGSYSMRVSSSGYRFNFATFGIDLSSAEGRANAPKNVTVVLDPEDPDLQIPGYSEDLLRWKAQKVELVTVRDSDEYAVWSVLLSKKYTTETSKEIVIEDRTALVKSDLILGPLSHFENAADAVSDLKTKSRDQYIVLNKFSANVPCTLISKETENAQFHFPLPDNRIDDEAVKRIQDGWNRFYKDHPDATGIITISRVGFNSDKTLAVVYVSFGRSLMVHNGRCFLLGKKNGTWEIEKEALIWLS